MPHTPVPWVSRGGLWIAGADGEMVADCVTKFTRGRGLQENEDNARFIVTAVNAHDELLTALEDAVHQLEQCGQGSCQGTVSACRAVIAKATQR
mgnify:CR=1 FL=1